MAIFCDSALFYHLMNLRYTLCVNQHWPAAIGIFVWIIFSKSPDFDDILIPCNILLGINLVTNKFTKTK